VCDLSVPPGLPADLVAQRPDLHFCPGGVARLPGGEDLDIPGFPLDRGLAYACMVEGMILGWAGIAGRSWIGTVTLDKVERMRQWATEHGVTLALRAPGPPERALAWRGDVES
jgi:predicted amino acid dehydrogenase